MEVNEDIYRKTTKILTDALVDKKKPLTTLYGVILGLSELGRGALRAFVVKGLKELSSRLEKHLEKGNSEATQASVTKIRDLLVVSP